MGRIHIETYCHAKRFSRADGAFVRHAIEEHWTRVNP
jgi:hypothetical protein